MGEFSLCCVAVFILMASSPSGDSVFLSASLCPRMLVTLAVCLSVFVCPERGPLNSHTLSPSFIVVAVATISYILRGYHIPLRARKHPMVCNETRDEQHAHTHTHTLTHTRSHTHTHTHTHTDIQVLGLLCPSQFILTY